MCNENTPMDDFEQEINDVITAIEVAGDRIKEFGHKTSPQEIEITVSKILASYICLLVASEEARAVEHERESHFVRGVIDHIPTIDDPNWKTYIADENLSTLKNRLIALWGIRIAYTHSDGNINHINNEYSRNAAIDAPNHIRGASLKGDYIILNNSSLHATHRTIVQVRDILN